MTGPSFACRASALLPLLLSAAALGAPVPASSNATGSATVLRPLTLVKDSDLDFGAVIATGAGTVVINPVSSATSVTGAVTPVGAAGHPAVFTTSGSKNSVVHINIPTNPVTLTRVGGTQTMTVSNWTLDGASNRKIPLTMAIDFAVGGTLTVAAGQAAGTYLGTFGVTVQYP
jgi:hypothetical protein